MPSDYAAITEENIRRRGEEFEDIGNFLAEKLYGDRSHFIYELLQNAEDALSRRREKNSGAQFSRDVTFRLFRDHLEVEHYGQPFDGEDVRGICDVLRGTKSERLDQIGTFGIGFKSVYAITGAPEIHSGDEHFVIEKFIRPRGVSPRLPDNDDRTLFLFPFDHATFKPEDAFPLIETKLKSLGARSLLFLNEVKAIVWQIEDAEKGCYMRETHPSHHGGSLVQIIGESTGQQDTEEEWLVEQRDVQHPTRTEHLPVKVAFGIQNKPNAKAIRPLSRSPLTAYFPTARETGLSFLAHGPFASTPARDNIESDSEWNDLLLTELARLVSDSLETCKNHGFIDASFLSLLPTDEETFPANSPFRPIYDAVLKALTSRPLIPCVSGTHAPATSLVLGRSKELRDLLPSDLLTELMSEESVSLDWVDAAVTENRLPKVWRYLRDKCGVQVVDAETFARRLSPLFLDARRDEWIVQFYSYLTGQDALWRAAYRNYPEGPLRTRPFIRCEDGQHRSPFDASGRPAVFLPIDAPTDYPIVCRSVYQDENAAEFLQRLGLVSPDLCAKVINTILPLYEDDQDITHSEHQKHLETIRDAMRLTQSPLYSKMKRALKSKSWVMARNAAHGSDRFLSPAELFVPSPNLQIFFEGNEDAWFLSETSEDIDWNALGVRSKPIVRCLGFGTAPHQYVTLASHHGWHVRGWGGFDPDTNIDGLEHALGTINRQKAAYVWNHLLPPLIRFLNGRYETATHQNYDNATIYEIDSELCTSLKAEAWIPVGDDEFRRPEECTVADMIGELIRNEDLARVLGIGPDPAIVANEKLNTHRSLVTQAGFSPDVAALLVQHRDEITTGLITKMVAARAGLETDMPEFPARPVRNKKRRTTRVRKRVRKADLKTYDKRRRSVRTSGPQVSPKLWLREMYTNAQDVTVCQMCRNAMPFRLPKTGEYYFEAVQVADNFSVEDHCLHLALCPLCAAKYTVLVKKPEDCLSEFIWAIEQAKAGDFEVPVQINGRPASVRFVETHMLDLKAALAECLSQE